MKLKNDVRLRNNLSDIEIVSGGNKKVGKITGHALPTLLGKNNFTSIGVGILDRLGCLEFEGIDPIYTVRGAVAEELALRYLRTMYNNVGLEVELKTFESRYQGSNGNWYGNDLFKSNLKYGGVIDIGITKPESQRAVVEVKSKSIKNYEMMFPKDKEPKQFDNEVYQGYHYSSLMGLNKLLMVYVFFTVEQENILKQFAYAPNYDENKVNGSALVDTIGFKVSDFVIEVVRNEVDIRLIKAKQDGAYELLRNAFNTRKIPIALFNEKDLEDLKDYFI